METIMLTAQQTPMERFDLYYKFLSAQILDELGRTKTLYLVRNDSTPVQVQDDLRNAIISVLTRFEIYDAPHAIAYGYKLFAGNGINAKQHIERKLGSIFPYQVTVKNLHHETHTIPVAVNKAEKFISRINLSQLEVHQLDDNWKPGWYVDDISHDTIYDMTKKANSVVNDILATTDHSFIFTKKEMVPVKVKLFKVMKRLPSVTALKNVNVTVSELVSMLWGDLIDDAIALEKELERKPGK